MKSLKSRWVCGVILATVVLSSNPGFGQTWSGKLADKELKLERVDVDKLPRAGTFWLWTRQGKSPPLPCYSPFLREVDAPVYRLNANVFLVDDTLCDYQAIFAARAEEKVLRKMEFEFGLMSAAEYYALEGGNGPIALYNYSSSDLWLSITQGVSPGFVTLTLHGSVQYDYYQWLSKTNLTQPGDWTLGEVMADNDTLGQFDFTPVFVGGNTNMFFKAHHAPYITVSLDQSPAIESNALFTAATVGSFQLNASTSAGLTIHYAMSGTASNNVDYTNLTGTVTIPPGNNSASVYVHPKPDTLIEGIETVVLTISQSDDYLIYGNASQTNFIWDSSASVSVVKYAGVDALETNGPPGAAGITGMFHVQRDDRDLIRPPMEVRYSMSGTTSNGVDYPFLNGVINFAQDQLEYFVEINPTDDSLFENSESVIFTLVPTNTYLIDPTQGSATMTIEDTTTTVAVIKQQDAIEPNPSSNISKQTGIFQIARNDSRFSASALSALTVSYQISGTASNGVDYTNITGSVTIAAGAPGTNVFIEPIFDGSTNQLEGDETVTLTLTHVGDGYLIDPSSASATLKIVDNIPTNTVRSVATLFQPAGIDYHQPSNALVVSTSLTGFNFAHIYTNVVSSNTVTVITNWSKVQGLSDEVKLVTVKTTGNGFTNGETFFGNGSSIGWLSADGTSSNLNWCILTNSVQTNSLHIRGSLCMDQTGVFSNHVIGVTSSGGPEPGKMKGVWRVDANRNPTLVASIDTLHLEGVIVLTNDVAQWGPWAGKIITGDEEKYPPPIYTITTNGVVTAYDTTTLTGDLDGIRTEDFEIIPPGQDLYACDLFRNILLKVSADNFTNYVGQLLITDAGDANGFVGKGKLFALRWDTATTNFVVRKILTFPSAVEHVTFAPIHLPPLTP